MLNNLSKLPTKNLTESYALESAFWLVPPSNIVKSLLHLISGHQNSLRFKNNGLESHKTQWFCEPLGTHYFPNSKCMALQNTPNVKSFTKNPIFLCIKGGNQKNYNSCSKVLSDISIFYKFIDLRGHYITEDNFNFSLTLNVVIKICRISTAIKSFFVTKCSQVSSANVKFFLKKVLQRKIHFR